MGARREVWVKIRASQAERAEDLKRQVKRLAADYKQIAEVLRGV